MQVTRVGLLTAVLIVAVVPSAGAQGVGSWDLGLALVTIPASRGLDTGDDPTKAVLGGGVWVAFNANRRLAIEAEVDGYFPQAELGLLGATPRRKVLAVAGPSLSLDVWGLSLAVKARPGVLRSRYDLVTFPATSRNDDDFAIDLGVVLEHRLAQRWLLRLDVSDLLVPSSDRASQPFDEHNLRLGLAVGLSL